MADKLLLLALKSRPKKLSLCNKNLEFIPKIIGKLDCICQLQLKNNKIKTLPEEFITLYKLQSLNLGNNEFEEFDSVFQHLESLQRLHLFGNKIMSINGNLLIGLKNLTFLNLNGNKLRTLPKEICNLSSIQDLSIDNNLLTDLPVEFCALISLKEFHAAGNKLISLPLEFGYLINLEKLFLQQNKIRELPESLGKCYKLHFLDVAANELRIFPTEVKITQHIHVHLHEWPRRLLKSILHTFVVNLCTILALLSPSQGKLENVQYGAHHLLTNLPLTELFCEENPLLQNVPVHSVQEEEILSLKELCARFVMEELKDRLSPLRKALRYYPDVRYMLTQSSKCAVCSHAFLNTWLECVKFIDAKKDLKLGSCSGSIPVRALLCSYKCFNAAGHGFFGVAFP